MQVRHTVIFAVAALTLLGSTAPAQAQVSPYATYSVDSTWDWYNHADDLPPLCGVSTWFDLRPMDSIADLGCVEAAMRQLGASESAIQFFDATKQFLTTIDTRSPIDFGHASSPWLNMARGESVLLNGAPSAILMSTVLPPEDNWKTLPGYAELLQLAPNAFPWPEYGGPLEERPSEGGRTIIDAEFEMRECRACAIVAMFRVEYVFDQTGFIASTTVLPPGPARP
jgi:hypothetical protein